MKDTKFPKQPGYAQVKNNPHSVGHPLLWSKHKLKVMKFLN